MLDRKHFETGNWVMAEDIAKEALGGRIYLHERQDQPAWHGGTIINWRPSEKPKRVIFSYILDGDFRVRCEGNWGQEKAIVRNTPVRT